jgi:single-strand DNA-binding protein
MSPASTRITVVGRMITDVTTRTTASGDKVANFRIACQERQYDKELSTWVDGDRMYVGISCWQSLADHVSESLNKGDQIVVSGRMKLREYTTDAGDRRMTLEVNANAIGPDLARHTVMVNRSGWAVHPEQQVLINPPPDTSPEKEVSEAEVPEAA